MDKRKLCQEVVKIARDASKIIKDNYHKVSGNDIKFKQVNDLVSFVDLETEQYLIRRLSTLITNSSFLAEESGKIINDGETGDYLWIIDPLDGTTNYIHGIPVFSISIALQYKSRTVVGVVYEVNQDECFYASEGHGAFMNDVPIKVSRTRQLSGSLVATGFPFREFEIVDEYLKIFRKLMKSTRGLRRLGSAAVDLAYVACGRFDSFYEFNLNPWDVAAGEFIIREAGGQVSDFNGNDNYLYGRQILASNSFVHSEMLNLIRK